MSLLLLLRGGASGPNTLAWTAALVADFTGSPWVGTATAGTSGANDATEGTNPPIVGGLANGYAAANFNGTNQLLTLDGVVSDYFGVFPVGYTVSTVFRADTLGAAGTYGFQEQTIIGDSGGIWGISVSASGIRFWSTSAGGAYFDTMLLPGTVAAGTKYCVQARFDGSNIQARVDGGAWSTPVAVSGFYFPGGANVARLGWGYSGALYHDGDIWEARLADFAISDTDADDFWTYADARYAITSTSVSGTLTSTLDDATATATGTVRVAGALASTLDAATATATGTVRVAGTLASTLGTATVAGTGTGCPVVSRALSRHRSLHCVGTRPVHREPPSRASRCAASDAALRGRFAPPVEGCRGARAE